MGQTASSAPQRIGIFFIVDFLQPFTRNAREYCAISGGLYSRDDLTGELPPAGQQNYSACSI
jgi:hypothetical protein